VNYSIVRGLIYSTVILLFT